MQSDCFYINHSKPMSNVIVSDMISQNGLTVVSRITAFLRMFRSQFLETEYVTYMAYFADMVKLRILRWSGYTVLSLWAQCDHQGPYKSETGLSESEKV